MKITDKITKLITPKRFSIFMGIVFLVTLIPMIILGFYNHPSADDFSIGYAAYHTFSDSGNIFATIGTAIAHAFDDWLNWMGYFTSTFLMSLPPSVFGEFAYKFSTLILLTALCSSIWYLFRMIFSKALGAEKYIVNAIVFIMLTWPVIIMLVLLIPLMIRAVRKTNFEFKYPLIIVFLGYGLTSAMMTPSLFALANIEAGRLRALTYIMFILTLVISEAYVIGWAVKKSAFIKKDVNISDGNFGKNELLMIVSVLLFTLFAVGITAVPEPDYFISTEAMLEVAGGEAATYSAELNERYEKYMSGDKNIVVKPLSVHPKLIFFVDMEGENEEWISNAVCRYYRLESVKIDGEE